MTGPIPATWAVDPDLAGAREVVPGLWRLRMPTSWPGVDHANAYLVDRDDGVMLVDTGPGGHASTRVALERALGQAGRRLDEVRALVITHAHSDHLGVAREVLDASGARLFMHPAAEHFQVAIREPERTLRRRARRAVREGLPPERVPPMASVEEELTGGAGLLHPDHDLLEGIRLPSRLGDWTVVEGTGHAPSQILLVQTKRRLAFVADAVCVVPAMWMDYGWSPDPIAEWRATLDRLEALGPWRYVLPGHGRPITELGPVLERYREAFDLLLAATRDSLVAGPASAYELLFRRHGRVPDDLEAIGHLTELLCALRHLRGSGVVARDEDDEGRFTYRLRRQ